MSLNPYETPLEESPAPGSLEPGREAMHWIVYAALWIFGTLAYFAVEEIGSWALGVKHEWDAKYALGYIVNGVLTGATIGVLPLAMVRRLRGQPFPVEPGEWNLCMNGAGFLIAHPIQIYLVTRGMFGLPVFLLPPVTLTVLYTIAALLCHRGLLWRGMFATLVLINAITALLLYNIAALPAKLVQALGDGTISTRNFIVNAILFGFAIGYDRMHDVKHSWLHYFGIGIAIASCLWSTLMIYLR